MSLTGNTPCEGVFALQRGDRLHGVRPTDRLGAGLRKAEVLDLAFSNEALHRAGDVLDRDIRIDAMLIEEIDPIGLEALERGFGDSLDVLRPAVQSSAALACGRVDVEAELRRNYDPIAQGRKGLADQFFVSKGPIDLCSVEESHAALDGRADQGYSRLTLDGRTVGMAETHAAKPHGRD